MCEGGCEFGLGSIVLNVDDEGHPFCEVSTGKKRRQLSRLVFVTMLQ